MLRANENGATKTGTKDCAAGTVADCAAGGQSGCKTVSSYISVETSLLTAANIKSGVTLAGVLGTSAGSLSDCSSDGATGCVATATYTAALTTGAASKILSGQSVAGVAGNVTLPAAGKVYTGITFGVSAGQTGTLTIPTAGNVLAASGTFGDPGAAVTPTLTIPTAGNVRTGNGTFGVAGTATTPTLANCSADGGVGCVAVATFKAADMSVAIAGNIKTGATIAGVAGSVTASPADCSTNGVTGCVTTATYQSGDLTNLTEGNIKNGTTIAGVAGLYPNATYKLPSADGAAGLTNATFDAKVKSATAFEYWTEAGAREESVGDADITAANIANGVSVFGLSGTLTGGSAPNAWDVRVGTVVNGVTGKLKVNCRNRVRSAVYNYDGAVGSIPNTGVATVSTNYDYWDTIDDYNNGVSGLPTGVVTGYAAKVPQNLQIIRSLLWKINLKWLCSKLGF